MTEEQQKKVEYAMKTIQELPEWEALKERFSTLEPELLSELANSHQPLSHQETRVFFMQRLGISDERIAEILYTHVVTVRKHSLSARHRLKSGNQ